MQKWQYKLDGISNPQGITPLEDIEEYLDIRYGSKGWELISVDNGIAYFKRPVDKATRNSEVVTWSEDFDWSMKVRR